MVPDRGVKRPGMRGAAVGLAAIFLCAASTPAGNPTLHRAEHQEQAQSESGQGHGNGHITSPRQGHPSRPAAAEVADQGAQSHDERSRPHWTEVATAIATVVLAIIAGGQAFLFIWQLRLMRRGVDDATTAADAAKESADAAKVAAEQSVEGNRLARDEFAANHPPHIIVRRVSLDEGTWFFNQPVTKAWKIQYIVANTGRGKASIFEGNATVAEVEKGLPAIPPFDDEGDFSGTFDLIAGESTPQFVYLKREVVDAFQSAIMIDGGKLEYKKSIYFFGYVQYRDQIGIVRRTAFCRLFDLKSRRFVAVADPDYEYS